MPLLPIRKINPHTYLAFWQLTETPEILAPILKTLAPAQLIIPTYPNAKRQTQWLAGRILAYTLLQKFTLEPILLNVDATGKPYFENNEYSLSISHTGQTVAVLLSAAYQVGIDIESIQPKVLRVKEKFLTISELDIIGEDLYKTLICWGTKETLYKLYGRKQLLFKEHLKIKKLKSHSEQTGIVEASIITPDFQKNYQVYYETEPNFILTYCIDTATELT